MKQGEIWLINLEPTIGAELQKTRPAIIVNDNALGKLPLKIIVPITEWKESHFVVNRKKIILENKHLSNITTNFFIVVKEKYYA